ncbi:hypothetical protein MLD38_006347 [Melastoma candidum]|uniref:Uncharacterized protein n=1 Tax=Melastoma candidum TaxID=119954 RepID=A0ACB9RMN5_9MYRT|nr:hypothetical protein MLD38_006347 [Melastoma candidum]
MICGKEWRWGRRPSVLIYFTVHLPKRSNTRGQISTSIHLPPLVGGYGHDLEEDGVGQHFHSSPHCPMLPSVSRKGSKLWSSCFSAV